MYSFLTEKIRRGAAVPAVVLFLCAFLLLSGCSSAPKAYSEDTGTGPRFVLELSPGESYRTTTKWFLFRIPIYPQVAAWVETTGGQYLGTIFVTAKGESNGWVSAPQEGRPEALPVWSSLREEELDAVSAATSSGETRYGSSFAEELPSGTYVVKLETNRSYDYNNTFTRENAGVSGQPSLIYTAQITVGSGQDQGVFTPVGTGSPDGSDGRIHQGFEGIDTALEMFSKMIISYRE